MCLPLIPLSLSLYPPLCISLPLSPFLSLSFYPPPSIPLSLSSLYPSLSILSLSLSLYPLSIPSLYPSPSIPSLYSPLSISLPLPPSLYPPSTPLPPSLHSPLTSSSFLPPSSPKMFTGKDAIQVSGPPNQAQTRNIAVVNALHAFNKLMDEVSSFT